MESKVSEFRNAESSGASDSYKEKATPEAKRALVSGTIGSALEWFDFAVYGAVAATVLPTLFFSNLSETAAQVASFATFAIGVVARPLGSLFFGYLGDRFGRRNILLTTFLLMGISSALIGFLPPVAMWGVASTFLLVTLRFLQGFALGGEVTGSQLLTMEHGPKKSRAFYGSLMSAGSPLSQVLANLLLMVLTATMTDEAFMSWGWRVPFWLSLLLVAVGIYMRFKVQETPVYEEKVEAAQIQTPNPLQVIRRFGWRILQMIICYSPITITFYLVTVFGISYMTSNVGFTRNETFTIMLIANSVSVFGVILGGILSDRLGRRNVLLTGAIGCLAFGAAFFPIVSTHEFLPAALIVTATCFMAQFGNGAHAALFAEAFPTAVRYQGSAFTLSGANLLFAAPAPMLASWSMGTFGSPLPLALTAGVFIVIAIITLLRTKEGRTLEGEIPTFRGHTNVRKAESI